MDAGDEVRQVARHRLYGGFAVDDNRWSAGVDASYGSRMRTAAGHGDLPTGTGSTRTSSSFRHRRTPAQGVRLGLPRTVMVGKTLCLGR